MIPCANDAAIQTLIIGALVAGAAYLIAKRIV